MCPHIAAAIKKLKYPADSSRGLGLGRTWHRTSRQRSPETRHARIREQRGGADKKSNQREQECSTTLNTTTHKHTSEDTNAHSPTLSRTLTHGNTTRRLYSQRWLCPHRPCRCRSQSAEHGRRPAQNIQTASKAQQSTRMNNTAGGNHRGSDCFVQESSRSQSRNRRTRHSDLHRANSK